MLNTRKFEVVFVSKIPRPRTSTTGASGPDTESFKEEWLRLPGTWVEGVKGGDAKPPDDGAETEVNASHPAISEIEEIIIDKLVEMHTEWINQSETKSG